MVNEALTHRLRLLCFEKMLQQDIGWFDMDENALSVLVARYEGNAIIIASAQQRS